MKRRESTKKVQRGNKCTSLGKKKKNPAPCNKNAVVLCNLRLGHDFEAASYFMPCERLPLLGKLT